MIRAYRESAATLVVRIASDESPLIAPDSTPTPGPLEIVNGSPVRYDSSIEPCPCDHFAVHRTDLVREHGQLVADDDLADRDVLEDGSHPAMRHGRHAARQGPQDRRRLRHRELLERVPARQHQDDDGAREVFAEQHRRDDRDAGQVVGAEAAVQAAADEIEDERETGDREHREERRVDGDAAQPTRAQNQMQGDARNREQRR